MSSIDHPPPVTMPRSPIRLDSTIVPRALLPLRSAWPLPQEATPAIDWSRPVADWVCWATALDFIQIPEAPPASPREPMLPAWARPLAAARRLRELARDGASGEWSAGRLVRLQLLLSPATLATLRERSAWAGGDPAGRRLAPPPDLLPALLDDLCAFLEWPGPDPLAQAALVHDQCLAIRPFDDGNRRLARVLAAAVASRGGIPPEALFPLFALAGRGRLAGDASRGSAALASRAAAWHEGFGRGVAFAGVLCNAVDDWTARLAARMGGMARAMRLAEVASARPVLDASLLRAASGAGVEALQANWQCLLDEGWTPLGADSEAPPWLAGTRFWQRAAALWAMAADAGRPPVMGQPSTLARQD
jgi:hypothetical protein